MQYTKIEVSTGSIKGKYPFGFVFLDCARGDERTQCDDNNNNRCPSCSRGVGDGGGGGGGAD